MQHHTLPTPTSRPARQGQHSQQSAASARPPLCWFDEYLMSIVPGHTPADENDLNIMLELMGATPETRDQVLESYNMMAKDLVKTAGVRVVGARRSHISSPISTVTMPGDETQANRSRLLCPDPQLAPRVPHLGRWDGFLRPLLCRFLRPSAQSIRQPSQGHSLHATSQPAGFGYVPHPQVSPTGHPLSTRMDQQSTMALTSRLLSLERSMGMDSFPEGEEKWMIPEGTYVTLRREGHPLFTFQMPNRRPQTIAQPRWGVM
ncbi:hypothetical protein L227DRAFT_658523 [Lentinus tigrinus ALCF2SS1-6]|uniref:Uncharacterized protein n=1 Tax=Lentinus tigrinus ALCF2SS1-6 TaxID=1328759 RepID=A0A5C2RNA0_9APHY|nr:hypothetical protein L227DRAFT_658523 [Lentinus tigrinus ALCF2SS1-6]